MELVKGALERIKPPTQEPRILPKKATKPTPIKEFEPEEFPAVTGFRSTNFKR